MYEISFAEPGAADDRSFVAEITDLVNEVYSAGEEGLWIQGTVRTGPEEIAGIISAGQLGVARDVDKLVGVVRAQMLPSGEGEFGLLAAHPAFRGAGVGRELVAFAEQWARDQGRTTMQLELLMPKTWVHPVKKFLEDWYTRIGYQRVRMDDFAAGYPQLAPRLATPCNFVVFHKPL